MQYLLNCDILKKILASFRNVIETVVLIPRFGNI